MTSFRNLMATDMDAALALCRAAGWNQRLEDWNLFLTLNPNGCRACVNDDGNVVGTVTTLRYGNSFTWVGMLLVDPQARRQGIGSALLSESLRVAGKDTTVRLDATPEGREVYRQLNFRDEYPLTRLAYPAGNKMASAALPARRITSQDLPGLLSIDQKVFGANRSALLALVLQLAPELCLTTSVQQIKGESIAYCFGRRGHNHTHIGPVIASDIEQAMRLVSSVIGGSPERSFIIDIPDRDAVWKDWLLSNGFIEQRSFMRMAHGSNEDFGILENQFAILGPEFG